MHTSCTQITQEMILQAIVNLVGGIEVRNLNLEQSSLIIETLRKQLDGNLSFENSKTLIFSILNTNEPSCCIEAIKKMENSYSFPSSNSLTPPNQTKRIKKGIWHHWEDVQLLSSMLKALTNNSANRIWAKAASFLKNGKTRLQCAQRWKRCLNPRISTKDWTSEEKERLKDLVFEYGEKAWVKISEILGNRTDVQCRYQWKQIQKNQYYQARQHEGGQNISLLSINSKTGSVNCRLPSGLPDMRLVDVGLPPMFPVMNPRQDFNLVIRQALQLIQIPETISTNTQEMQSDNEQLLMWNEEGFQSNDDTNFYDPNNANFEDAFN